MTTALAAPVVSLVPVMNACRAVSKKIAVPEMVKEEEAPLLITD